MSLAEVVRRLTYCPNIYSLTYAPVTQATIYKTVKTRENPIPAQAINSPHFILKRIAFLSELISFLTLKRFFKATYPAINGGIPYSQQKQSENAARMKAAFNPVLASHIFLRIGVFDIGAKVMINYQ